MATHSVFLPGKSHGQRSLAGYTPWAFKRVRQDLTTKQYLYIGFLFAARTNHYKLCITCISSYSDASEV